MTKNNLLGAALGALGGLLVGALVLLQALSVSAPVKYDLTYGRQKMSELIGTDAVTLGLALIALAAFGYLAYVLFNGRKDEPVYTIAALVALVICTIVVALRVDGSVSDDSGHLWMVIFTTLISAAIGGGFGALISNFAQKASN